MRKTKTADTARIEAEYCANVIYSGTAEVGYDREVRASYLRTQAIEYRGTPAESRFQNASDLFAASRDLEAYKAILGH